MRRLPEWASPFAAQVVARLRQLKRLICVRVDIEPEVAGKDVDALVDRLIDADEQNAARQTPARFELQDVLPAAEWARRSRRIAAGRRQRRVQIARTQRGPTA